MQINEIKNLCNKLGLHPSKNMGQNFLLDENVVKKMADAAELKNSDTVLEIGPGFGVLTSELVKWANKVVVVEKDRRLAEYLSISNKQLTINNKLKIINEDILKLSFFRHSERSASGRRAMGSLSDKISSARLSSDLGMTNYKIISNLPYQITSPVLWKFLMEEKNKPELMVVMVQKEVGERICAKPGQMSVLSVMCQLHADCEFLFEVKRDKFYPAPDVDSAVIKLKLKTQSTKPKTTTSPQPSPYKGEGDDFNEKDFIRLIKFGFSAKRKMLKNNLSGGLQKPMAEVVAALKSAGLDEKVRAQELAVSDWIKLYKQLTTNN
ncbi:MAG: 16S rRNA (adenine(1518)-N(6)/adenine(1519)-N(6))-dimethyltransferase RsmA [Patescibacteria group bacterium]|nr:16S rRNA (adenine(1518)-N(6)/adenine(1519)-N(6))-dimethyltransferase RsmA [Patescibacteria group bacterium]